jgi:hypothetical protein
MLVALLLGIVLVVAVVAFFAIAGAILHFLFLALVVAAICMLALRVGRRARRR